MSNLSPESIQRVLSDSDQRIHAARMALGKALFALQHRVDELLPIDAQELTWVDLARSLPADLSQFEARLRRAELAVFDAVGAYEQVQVRERQKSQMASAAAKKR